MWLRNLKYWLAILSYGFSGRLFPSSFQGEFTRVRAGSVGGMKIMMLSVVTNGVKLSISPPTGFRSVW